MPKPKSTLLTSRAFLIQAPLAEFVAERKRLSLELKTAGDKEGAKALASTAKPGASAWAVNQLHWQATAEPKQTALREYARNIFAIYRTPTGDEPEPAKPPVSDLTGPDHTKLPGLSGASAGSTLVIFAKVETRLPARVKASAIFV